MPPQLRGGYTECESAALYIVAREVKRHGICDLSVGQILAEAGVGKRTVQNAVAEGVRQGHIAREERRGCGGRNDTNILRIVSREWIAWLKRGPKLDLVSGCKVSTATKNIDIKKEGRPRFSATEYRAEYRVSRILSVVDGPRLATGP